MRESKHPFRLHALMLLIMFFYLFPFSVCSISMYQFISVEEAASDKINEMKSLEILKNIFLDKDLCFHCVQRHLTFDPTTLAEKQQVWIKRNEYLRWTRFGLNMLSATNTVIPVIVFDGSKLISVVSILSSFSIIASFFVENTRDVILLESSVVLTSMIVVIKSSYVLCATMIIISKKKNR